MQSEVMVIPRFQIIWRDERPAIAIDGTIEWEGVQTYLSYDTGKDIVGCLNKYYDQYMTEEEEGG